MSELDPENFYVCQRCTACCKWPGDVRVTDEEVEKIAKYLGIPLDEFLQDFTRLRRDRKGLSLIEKPNHECSMLENGGCKINKVKPKQCSGFPNVWNFPGWRDVCEATPMPMQQAIEEGRVPKHVQETLGRPRKF